MNSLNPIKVGRWQEWLGVPCVRTGPAVIAVAWAMAPPSDQAKPCERCRQKDPALLSPLVPLPSIPGQFQAKTVSECQIQLAG